MVIDIAIKSINTFKLKSEIHSLEKNNKRPSYLIMNENTYKALKKEYEGTTIVKTYGDWNSYTTLYGVPIAICQKLEFGEVDIIII